MDHKINFHVYVVYSPDEAIYYLENRDPDNWANSIMGWSHQAGAVKAYHDGIVGWANWNDEVVTVKQKLHLGNQPGQAFFWASFQTGFINHSGFITGYDVVGQTVS